MFLQTVREVMTECRVEHAKGKIVLFVCRAGRHRSALGLALFATSAITATAEHQGYVSEANEDSYASMAPAAVIMTAESPEERRKRMAFSAERLEDLPVNFQNYYTFSCLSDLTS